MWQFRPDPADSFAVTMAGCRRGTFLFSANDLVGKALLLYGEWGEVELTLLTGLLRRGDIVIDVGAHIGTFAIPFARAVGPDGRVFAFEPQRFVYNLLCGNTALNGVPQLVAENLAVGDASRTMPMPFIDYARPGNFGTWSLAGAARSVPAGPAGNIRVTSLDDRFPRLPRCRLLKIDVEGLEDAVLAGAERLIARTRPLIHFELNRQDVSPTIDRLRGWNYRLHWHGTPGFNPNNFAGTSRNIFGTLGDLNVLGVPMEYPEQFPELPVCRSFDEVPHLFPGLLTRSAFRHGGA